MRGDDAHQRRRFRNASRYAGVCRSFVAAVQDRPKRVRLLAHTLREEVFGPLGITVRTFRDPEGSNRVGLIVEVPDIATWEEAMQGEGAAAAMKFDGVRAETILGLVEA